MLSSATVSLMPPDDVPTDPDGVPPAASLQARRIEEAIKRSGLSKSEVARRLKTSYVTVNRWTTGESRPSARFLRALPEVVGMTLEELLGVAEGQDPPFESWQQFVATPEGSGMSPGERRALQGLPWPPGTTPTVSSYLVALTAVRSAVRRE